MRTRHPSVHLLSSWTILREAGQHFTVTSARACQRKTMLQGCLDHPTTSTGAAESYQRVHVGQVVLQGFQVGLITDRIDDTDGITPCHHATVEPEDPLYTNMWGMVIVSPRHNTFYPPWILALIQPCVRNTYIPGYSWQHPGCVSHKGLAMPGPKSRRDARTTRPVEGCPVLLPPPSSAAESTPIIPVRRFD